MRVVGRTQEQTTWSPWPRTTPAVVSRFGTLDGLERIRPRSRLELLPYATGGFDAPPGGTGDPLNSKLAPKGGVGLDLKYGLGPAFTLSATINPDFGQVEQDPSQVNLSPNQLFFAEKRPFFLEGTDLFKLSIGNSDGGPEGQFYSRRIGAAPDVPNVPYNYVQQPDASTIYGAAKLTGKTPSGWSVGLLDAVTGGESASYIDLNNATVHAGRRGADQLRRSGRVKRDLDGRPDVARRIVHRRRSRARQQRARRDASPIRPTPAGDADPISAGATTRGSRTRRSARSCVHGIRGRDRGAPGNQPPLVPTPRRDRRLISIRRARSMASASSYGRSAGSATPSTGASGSAAICARPGSSSTTSDTRTASDHYIPFVWGQYHENAPSDQLLNWSVSGDVFTVSNFEPTLEDQGLRVERQRQLSNYWSMGDYYNLQSARLGSGRAARRADAAHESDRRNANAVHPDRSALKLRAQPRTATASATGPADVVQGEVDLERDDPGALEPRPVRSARRSCERNDPMQYVAQATDADGALHYIFGAINQVTDDDDRAARTGRSRRIWRCRPTRSRSSRTGRYNELKDVDNPHAAEFGDRFHVLVGNEIAKPTTSSSFATTRGA